MRYGVHSADITCLSLATKLGVLGVGDASGLASVLDLAGPAQLFTVVPAGPQAVRQVAFGAHVVPEAPAAAAVAGKEAGEKAGGEGAPARRSSSGSGEGAGVGSSAAGGEDRMEKMVMFVASENSTCAIVLLESGVVLGKVCACPPAWTLIASPPPSSLLPSSC
jgi:hypothetical protein